jgi:hypothetical protein
MFGITNCVHSFVGLFILFIFCLFIFIFPFFFVSRYNGELRVFLVFVRRQQKYHIFAPTLFPTLRGKLSRFIESSIDRSDSDAMNIEGVVLRWVLAGQIDRVNMLLLHQYTKAEQFHSRANFEFKGYR